MLLKTIFCSAKDGDAFAQAQAGWTELRAVDGFCGQVGGWHRDGEEAWLLAGWRDEAAHRAFLADAHDRIEAASGVRETLVGWSTRFWDCSAEADRFPPCAAAGAIRLSYARLGPGHAEPFDRMLQEIWVPALQGSAEMNGALLGRRQTDGQERRLLVTAWKTVEAHDLYVTGALQRLREIGALEACCTERGSRTFETVSAWRVLPALAAEGD